ncbi:hypothetical protein [Thiocystis violacea]|uniref:hypothetical protein n=1 Tax=Thiocystis violacea TaxID=13725 RepID=UPI001905436F|nr:hypothetical protein [Thiocystis violacea]MBK1716893.1 hypothetical protein [Thiocystis violacea]
MKLEAVSIKQCITLNEKWVQDQIAEDPPILGLGDLILKDKERIQQHAGRLDLLLQDPETLKRYEVEIQLGATDESHIIRTIEYWDIERKRYPQYEHAAVIIAENITSRFLNVIQLFNGTIPLIAIKITAYKVGNEYALTFVKVLDEMSLGLVDEDEPISEPTDRAFWETKRGTTKTLQLTDSLLALVKKVEPRAALKYNKHYIGIEVNGIARNFVTFMPRKAHVIMTIKLPKTDETDSLLDEVALQKLNYENQWRQYRIKLDLLANADDEKQKEAILNLVKEANENFGGSF